MYRFHWSLFATDALLDELARLADVDQGVAREKLRPLVARVLSIVGGLRVVPEKLSISRRTEIARGLLQEAMGHVLSRSVATPTVPGYCESPSNGTPIQKIIQAVTRVPVNSTNAEGLAHGLKLPESVAAEIVHERTMRGPFSSLEEFERRVRGIGPKLRDAVAAVVRFDTPTERLANHNVDLSDYGACVARLVAVQDGAAPMARLEAALDMLATECAASPHPATRFGLPREHSETASAIKTDSDWLGILYGADYPRLLPTIFDAAKARIDVCMFHIALPGPEHPTRALLESLVAAHRRGIEVRVLVDRDRPTDPYHSTVINSKARTFLLKGGVDCRWDQAGRLLHSKYVLVDEDHVILGSHNWSEGSYAEFDDLSLAVKSRDLATTLRKRFESLWARTKK